MDTETIECTGYFWYRDSSPAYILNLYDQSNVDQDSCRLANGAQAIFSDVAQVSGSDRGAFIEEFPFMFEELIDKVLIITHGGYIVGCADIRSNALFD